MSRLKKNLIQINHSNSEELIVLSTYFSSKEDPVRGGYQNSNNFSYLKDWYESVIKHGLRAFVFYDNLSSNFIDEYQTEYIKFIKCQLGGMSLNDERFFIFHEFISLLPDDSFVLITDINDVVIHKNPLPLLQSLPNKLFIGRGNRRVWKYGIWTLNSLRQFSRKFNKSIPISFLDYPVFNPGTLGGSKINLLELLKKMNLIFETLHDDQNYDMPVFNYVLKEYYFPRSSWFDGIIPFGLAWNFWYYTYRIQRKLDLRYKKEKYDLSSHQESVVENDKIVAGHPFVSMFSWYENPSIAYLIHK